MSVSVRECEKEMSEGLGVRVSERVREGFARHHCVAKSCMYVHTYICMYV